VKSTIKDAVTWVQRHSLWLMSIGLMLASSGIDGAYMSRWMPDAWGWLGLVLNTVADISGMAIMYYYGQLIRIEAKGTKKHKLARLLLIAEAVAGKQHVDQGDFDAFLNSPLVL